MGSNQSSKSKAEIKGSESLLIEDDDKNFVKRKSSDLIIDTVEHVTKAQMSRQDKEGIRHAIENGNQKMLAEKIRKVVPQDKRGPFVGILDGIKEETDYYSAVDWTGLVVGGVGGGVAGVAVGAECGAMFGPVGVIAGGIFGGLLVAIIGAFTGLQCARLIAWLCKWLGEMIKSILKNVSAEASSTGSAVLA